MAEARNFLLATQKPLILLSPLDWGLGHTTRCIPIIRELDHLGWQVIVACNSAQKAILEPEFPHLTFHFLAGYNVFYGQNRAITWIRLLFQVPKILIRIKKEKKWVKEFLQQAPVKAIISDNRYGFYAAGIPCIFISHQLLIKTGAGSRADRWLQMLHYRLIRKFTACWVPDSEGPENAAGELSHPAIKPPVPVKYLGCLSRLRSCKASGYKYEILILLSGPEPQRSILEKILLQQLPGYKGTVALVRGNPLSAGQLKLPANITVYNHLPADALNELICSSNLIISRSGYSTIMDLLKLGKKMVLIPTPGQTEQQYLAEYLRKRSIAYTAKQQGFSLEKVIEDAEGFTFRPVAWDMERYKEVLKESLTALLFSQQS